VQLIRARIPSSNFTLEVENQGGRDSSTSRTAEVPLQQVDETLSRGRRLAMLPHASFDRNRSMPTTAVPRIGGIVNPEDVLMNEQAKTCRLTSLVKRCSPKRTGCVGENFSDQPGRPLM